MLRLLACCRRVYIFALAFALVCFALCKLASMTYHNIAKHYFINIDETSRRHFQYALNNHRLLCEDSVALIMLISEHT